MNLKKTVKIFITIASLLLICTSSAFAEDQVQHQTGIIDALKNYWNTFQFCGEILLSKTSYEINHHTDIADDDNVTTQVDLDFWNNLKAQYPFSEKPVFISLDNGFGLVYNFVPEGVSGVTVMDNSRNALDFYTVTKKEKGFQFKRELPVIRITDSE